MYIMESKRLDPSLVLALLPCGTSARHRAPCVLMPVSPRAGRFQRYELDQHFMTSSSCVMTHGNIIGILSAARPNGRMEGQVEMRLERTPAGWLSTRVRFLVIAAILLAVAGVTIPLMANSGTTAQPAQPARPAG